MSAAFAADASSAVTGSELTPFEVALSIAAAAEDACARRARRLPLPPGPRRPLLTDPADDRRGPGHNYTTTAMAASLSKANRPPSRTSVRASSGAQSAARWPYIWEHDVTLAPAAGGAQGWSLTRRAGRRAARTRGWRLLRCAALVGQAGGEAEWRAPWNWLQCRCQAGLNMCLRGAEDGISGRCRRRHRPCKVSHVHLAVRGWYRVSSEEVMHTSGQHHTTNRTCQVLALHRGGRIQGRSP